MRNVLGCLFLALLFFSCSRKITSTFRLPEMMELDDVLAKAQVEGKPVFIDVYASWCGPCKWMDKNTFSDPTLQRYLTTKFICVKVDADSFEGANTTIRYKINTLPTYLFLDAQGKVLNRVSGMMQPDAFEREAEYAMDLRRSR